MDRPISNGTSSRTNCWATTNGVMAAERPRMTRMLKILLPMTLPRAISASPPSAD